MRVRQGRAAPRKTALPQSTFQHKIFPAPSGGLVLSENLANMPPNSAIVLNNGFPTLTGTRVRGGSQKVASIGTTVESLFTYVEATTQKIFAAGGGAIYDVTSPADVDVTPTADLTGQTSNYYSTTPFSTAAGEYLMAVNGTDAVLRYDGGSWTTPTITGTTSAELSQVFAYRNRLYFIRKNTLKFAYLGINSISGAASEFSLYGVFNRGGSLLFGATWSQDAGDGLDDKAVFVTDQGEVAIYEGSDPSVATDWNLVGRYDIKPPLGKNAFTHAGGDLIIMTQDGMVPISMAVNKEPSVLALSAVSRPIEPLWKNEVRLRTLPWEIVEIPKLNMGVVSLPHTGAAENKCLVVNLNTSRWGVYTGWDTRCVAEFLGDGYFGSQDGSISKMETTGADNGVPYVFQCALAHDHLESPGMYKTAKMGRCTFLARENFNPTVSVAVDYSEEFPAAPVAGLEAGLGNLWDSALWDGSIWDAGLKQDPRSEWFTIGRSGYSISPQVQATIANTLGPDAEMVAIDISIEMGGLHIG